MSQINNQQQFDNIIKIYLEQLNFIDTSSSPELEIRFGTRAIKPITLIEFNHVIRKLKSLGFEAEYDIYSLRIGSEYTDKNTGETKDSNVRVELNGIHNIQSYCNSNKLTEKNAPQFTQKTLYKNDIELMIRNVGLKK